MKIFDLYGIRAATLDEAKCLVEAVIGQILQPHESSYHCGDYWRFNHPDGGEIILQKNYDDYDLEWTEEAFKEAPYLLYVSQYPEANNLKIAFNKCAQISYLSGDGLP